LDEHAVHAISPTLSHHVNPVRSICSRKCRIEQSKLTAIVDNEVTQIIIALFFRVHSIPLLINFDGASIKEV